MQQSFSGIMQYYTINDPIEMSATLQAYAIQPTTLEEYVKRTLNLT